MKEYFPRCHIKLMESLVPNQLFRIFIRNSHKWAMHLGTNFASVNSQRLENIFCVFLEYWVTDNFYHYLLLLLVLNRPNPFHLGKEKPNQIYSNLWSLHFYLYKLCGYFHTHILLQNAVSMILLDIRKHWHISIELQKWVQVFPLILWTSLNELFSQLNNQVIN